MAGYKTVNVCHIASGDLWAGAEVQMYTLIASLIKEPGFQVTAIIMNRGKLADKLRKLGIEVVVLEENRNDFVKLRRLAVAFLQNKNIDIIHSHRFKENILAASIRNKCKIKRLIQTVHGVSEPRRGLSSIKSRFFASLNLTITSRYFDKVIAVSDDIRRQLESFYPASKLVTIHNAIDPRKIQPGRTADSVRGEFNIDKVTPLIGAAGRMVPVKAYDMFLNMAQIILETRPEAKFMLVGDGPLKKSLQDMAAAMNLAEKVIFPGFRDDIIDIINAFDIFVFSSLHEGVPMALLEAMALKKAIVSTAVGGINEVIKDGVSGLLVQPQSPQALAEGCLSILGDGKLKENLESGALKRVNEEFSVDLLREKVVNLYRESLN